MANKDDEANPPGSNHPRHLAAISDTDTFNNGELISTAVLPQSLIPLGHRTSTQMPGAVRPAQKGLKDPETAPEYTDVHPETDGALSHRSHQPLVH